MHLVLDVVQADERVELVEQVLDAVVRVDADALIALGRFLQEKFGQLGPAAPLDPPPAAAPRSSLDLP